MKPIDLNSWEDFIDRMSSLLEDNHTIKSGRRSVSPILFRGQSSESQSLSTTLERTTGILKWNLSDYLKRTLSIKAKIESFTDSSWEMPTYKEIDNWQKTADTTLAGGIPGYEYLIYLRHHGFPSPLLDWTFSPYIAAFFAFRESYTSDRIAVYTYQEHVGKGKDYSSAKPLISVCTESGFSQ